MNYTDTLTPTGLCSLRGSDSVFHGRTGTPARIFTKIYLRKMRPSYSVSRKGEEKMRW